MTPSEGVLNVLYQGLSSPHFIEEIDTRILALASGSVRKMFLQPCIQVYEPDDQNAAQEQTFGETYLKRVH